MTSSRSARTVGMLVFWIGITLLVIVFFQAWADLKQPLQGTSANMGLTLIQKLGFLFVMGYAASSIAGRGCQMMQSALIKTVEVAEE
jgi:hypothetical protein